ncbi:MAG: type IV pilus assembly protein PilA [Candidatus Saccharimonadales bacterium]|jgi:type IV pilus assembly protein PilA
MLKQLRKQNGFTIIELLIVIAIIGILATLVLTNFQGAQARGRDTVRQNDINSIYQKLEEFHNENNGYPDGELDGTVAVGINGAVAGVATSVFPGIDAGALVDDDDATILASFATEAAQTLPTVPISTAANDYVYSAYGCTGTAAVALVGATCTKYHLVSFQEQDANGWTRSSLN